MVHTTLLHKTPYGAEKTMYYLASATALLMNSTKKYFPRFWLYILLQSTLNSESRPRRLLQKIYNSMKPMSGRLCGLLWWLWMNTSRRLPDIFYTLRHYWPPQPTDWNWNTLPCVILLSIKVSFFLIRGIDNMRDKYDDTDDDDGIDDGIWVATRKERTIVLELAASQW